MNALPPLFGSKPDAGPERTSFGVQDLGRMLRKHATLIFTCFVIVTAVVTWGVTRLPATYASSALVLVKLEQAGTPSFFSGIAALRDSNTQDSANRRMENEMELAESWPLSAEVVRTLGLTYEQVYHPPLTHLVRPFTDVFDRYVAPLIGIAPDPEKNGFGDTVTAFRKSIEVRPVVSKSSDTNSNIVSFQIRGTDPERARRSLEQLVNRFLQHDAVESRAAARKAQAVVLRHAKIAEAEVAEAQGKLAAFLAGATPNQAGSREEDAVPRDQAALARLKARLQDLRVELVELRSQYAAPTDQTRALEGSIATLTQDLERELRGAARGDAVLQERERDLRLKESALIDLRKRLGQIDLYLDMGDADITNRVVVEPPLSARGSDWKTRLAIAAAGSVAGLFLGLALAGLRELIDPRLQTPADARAALGLPVLATMPAFKPGMIQRGFASVRPTTGNANVPSSVHAQSS